MDVDIIERRTFIIFLYKLTQLEQLTWKFNIKWYIFRILVPSITLSSYYLLSYIFEIKYNEVKVNFLLSLVIFWHIHK